MCQRVYCINPLMFLFVAAHITVTGYCRYRENSGLVPRQVPMEVRQALPVRYSFSQLMCAARPQISLLTRSDSAMQDSLFLSYMKVVLPQLYKDVSWLYVQKDIIFKINVFNMTLFSQKNCKRVLKINCLRCCAKYR